MSGLAKISTLELQEELLKRAFLKSSATAKELETALRNVRERQTRQTVELFRLRDQIAKQKRDDVSKPKPVVKPTPKPLRKRAVKGGAS